MPSLESVIACLKKRPMTVAAIAAETNSTKSTTGQALQLGRRKGILQVPAERGGEWSLKDGSPIKTMNDLAQRHARVATKRPRAAARRSSQPKTGDALIEQLEARAADHDRKAAKIRSVIADLRALEG